MLSSVQTSGFDNSNLVPDISSICNAADGLVKVGNRTECALLELCTALGGSYTRIRASQELVRRYPFSSDRKRMSSLTFNPGERHALVLCKLRNSAVHYYNPGPCSCMLGDPTHLSLGMMIISQMSRPS